MHYKEKQNYKQEQCLAFLGNKQMTDHLHHFGREKESHQYSLPVEKQLHQHIQGVLISKKKKTAQEGYFLFLLF